MAKDRKLVDRFGGLGDAIDEAKKRMGLSRDERVQLVELPNLPAGIFGTLGKLIGLQAEPPAQAQAQDLPLVRQLLQGIPSSLLIDPSKPQARLPYDFNWSP